MNQFYPYSEEINLHVEGRISSVDAARQERTAREILRRLETQPGLILADEVGMGKTFVALAVAVSIALSDEMKRPVVIMVPPSLKEKWPKDFDLFREKCLEKGVAPGIRYGVAERAVEFLKSLDDPPERKKSIIFLTHGAMYRALNDGWVKLALIQRALYRRKNTDLLRRALSRIMGQLLRMGWVDRYGTEVWQRFMDTNPLEWLKVLKRYGVDPENDSNTESDDDPVPKDILDALEDINADKVFEALQDIPYRQTKHFDSHLENARRKIAEEMRSLWRKCLENLRFRLPLLVLDEAHHLKNPDTQFASLFQVRDAQGDAEELSKGPLAGIFERMLFLTATPFQLGHHELCSVLDRFTGIFWHENNPLPMTKDEFTTKTGELRRCLDSAQESALRLDDAWGKLTPSDLYAEGIILEDVREWWPKAQNAKDLTQTAQTLMIRFKQAKEHMKKAEESLKPWVIRHIKPKKLPNAQDVMRRLSVFGKGILNDSEVTSESGLDVQDAALLPFLLAARATVCMQDSRPVFAEGLASSYEAFLHTRTQEDTSRGTDTDDEMDLVELCAPETSSRWYLDKLESVLKKGSIEMSLSHPKIAATVKRSIDLWRGGEKVLIFCHYIATGRALRQYISDAMGQEIVERGRLKIGCEKDAVEAELERIGEQFFKENSIIRMAYDAEIGSMLNKYADLDPYKTEITDVIRRYLRTPSFLVRFFPLEDRTPSREAVIKAFDSPDSSGLTLRQIMIEFLKFLRVRCGDEDRSRYITAVNNLQTGSHYGADVSKTFGEDEIQGDRSGRLVPSVRLVNGQTKSETRQRIMLTFNTPFYPEILIASSVMAEGVDLQLNCRHVIHHDLCWNPSTLEQRTGRIDRIGAKAELCGKSIYVYIPYIAETQDEKMYKVVMDRERWFKVVMGEKFKVDYKTTEKLSERLPLPEAAAEELMFRLEVV